MAASTNLTPEQRRLRASIAANARWGKTSDGERTTNAQRAQAGLLDSFRRRVTEEDPTVTEPDLTRRAESLRREHMARMSFAASKARTERRKR